MQFSQNRSATVRLAGFAAVLLLVFGGATVAGGAIGPNREGDRAAAGDDAMAAHAGDESAPDVVRGLAVSEGGLRLVLNQTELDRDRRTELSFAIAGADGRPVRDFAIEHEKLMHLIVVRRDGHGFRHVHPALGEDGIWRVRLALPRARRLSRVRGLQARGRGADPRGRTVGFMTEFPSDGRYRLYMQFKHGGRVHTAEFTQEVGR